MIRIRRGLDLHIPGEPEQQIHPGKPVRTVALLGPDFLGLKPRLAVQVGDQVALGDTLLTDRGNDELPFTAPAGGTVSAIHRGMRRLLLAVVIDVAKEEEPQREFAIPDRPDADQIRSILQESGMWPAFRTRPFAYVPGRSATPDALFVNAMDSNPLAAKPELLIASYQQFFQRGLEVLAKMYSGPKYCCKAPGPSLPMGLPEAYRVEEFAGPHPAGLSGTHIHFLAPVGGSRNVWTIRCPEVIAIGHLFSTGRLMSEKIIALGGPPVDKPRLIRSRWGASVEELCAGELQPGEHRLISGSVLSGRSAHGALAWLGRDHSQISVLDEGRQREFLGWLSPGVNRHSAMRIYASNFMSKRRPLRFDTSTNGSERAMVPTGNYERVMPLDILPTHLLRALLVGDSEMAKQLGCLELAEEDLGLSTYVCSGKYEYGPVLRSMLDRIAKEG